MMHSEQHSLAGQTVSVDIGQGYQDYRVEDWWDRLTGGSWMDAVGNPAALNYAMRVATERLPINDDVVYGKIGAFGYLVHVSEIRGK